MNEKLDRKKGAVVSEQQPINMKPIVGAWMRRANSDYYSENEDDYIGFECACVADAIRVMRWANVLGPREPIPVRWRVHIYPQPDGEWLFTREPAVGVYHAPSREAGEPGPRPGVSADPGYICEPWHLGLDFFDTAVRRLLRHGRAKIVVEYE